MTQHNPVATDDIQQFANNAFLDSTFPKQSVDFDDISNYLEENTTYLMSMVTFDQAWELFQAQR